MEPDPFSQQSRVLRNYYAMAPELIYMTTFAQHVHYDLEAKKYALETKVEAPKPQEPFEENRYVFNGIGD